MSNKRPCTTIKVSEMMEWVKSNPDYEIKVFGDQHISEKDPMILMGSHVSVCNLIEWKTLHIKKEGN